MGVSIDRPLRRSGLILSLLVVPALLAPALLTPAADGSPGESASTALAGGSQTIPAEELKARLDSIGTPGYVDLDARGWVLWAGVRRVYEARGYRPLWVEGHRMTRPAESFLRTALRADGEGLDTAPYTALASQARTIRSASPADWADPAVDLDLRLTYTFLRYATEMTHGRFSPRGVSPLWALEPAGADAAALLAQAADAGRIEDVLEHLVPSHGQYQALRRELAQCRALAARGGWGTVEPGPALKPGQRSPRVAALRARLVASGDLPETAPPSSMTTQSEGRQGGRDAAPPLLTHDRELAHALKSFEARHGLTPDGILDKAAVETLNVPVEERIRQIELNLERWRWLPRDLGDRHVLVNIPTFELHAFEAGHRALHMRVVTGKAGDNPTPVFRQEMTHLVFSPYWNVPPGIATEETRPAVLRNPSYLFRNNLEVVRGSRVVNPLAVNLNDPSLQFRQRPGRGNALGQVKFLLPNRFNVYLHDTPSRALFARVRRDYSHGCVRVQKPFELARWVLEGTEWSPERIRAAMEAGQERYVRLPRPVPVYIAYFTVWIDDEGRTQFRPDLYRHDAAQLGLLPESLPVPDPSLKVAGTTLATAAAAF